MLIKVKCFPSSKKEKVLKIDEDAFEVYVKEKAEHNLANQKVKELLCKFLKVSAGDVKMIKGSKNRSKIFKINQDE